ncbi:MAG: phage tail tape measure protein, partial [Candidatus Binataceae bacterium]
MLRDFKFGFSFETIRESVSGSIAKIETKMKGLNEAVENTATWRTAGRNIAMGGAAVAGAGAAIGYALYKTVGAYESLQDAQQRLRDDMGATVAGFHFIAKATAAAEAASVKYNVSTEDALENVRLAVSGTLTQKQALDALVPSIELAKAGLGSTADSGRFLATVFTNFGNKSADAKKQLTSFADMTAYVVSQKAFANLGELRDALKESLGSAKAFGMTYQQTVTAIAGFSAAGITGSMAGTALEETLNAIGRGGFGKLGVAVARNKDHSINALQTIMNFQEHFAHRTKTPELIHEMSKALGIRGTQVLALDSAQLGGMIKEFQSGAYHGAAAKGAATIMDALREKVGSLGQALHNLNTTMGKPLATSLMPIVQNLTKIIVKTNEWAQHHSELVKFAMTFAAIGAAVLVVGGSVLVAIGAIGMMASAGAVLAVGFGIVAGVATAMWVAITGPIGLAVAAIALVGLAVYEIYEHWDGIKSYFSGLWKSIIATIKGWETTMYNAGANIISSLAAGMASRAMYPIHAAEHIAGTIKNFFVGHSPPPEGPLRDLNRVRIVETIAESINAQPAIAAMRRVAMAMAMAAPMVAGPMLMPAAAAARTAFAGGA